MSIAVHEETHAGSGHPSGIFRTWPARILRKFLMALSLAMDPAEMPYF